jgi:hypothetical protein
MWARIEAFGDDVGAGGRTLGEDRQSDDRGKDDSNLHQESPPLAARFASAWLNPRPILAAGVSVRKGPGRHRAAFMPFHGVLAIPGHSRHRHGVGNAGRTSQDDPHVVNWFQNRPRSGIVES